MAPDDDTAAALVALRGLGTERAADEAAELAAIPGSPAEQAALALAILEDQRPRSVEDRRTLGLPRAAAPGAWLSTVERRLGELDDATVIDQWLIRVERGASLRRRVVAAVAIAALARPPSLTPWLDRLDRVLRGSAGGARSVILEAMQQRTAPVDPGMLAVLRRILGDPAILRDVAEDAVRIASACARRAPDAAALIAARARSDRGQRLAEAVSSTPRDQRTAISSAALAEAIHASGCPGLAATVLLELERPYERARWAQALLAIAGDAGARYLARMRGRPGWSALAGTAPEPPADPLEGLTSPLADVRRAALEALASAPRSAHLQAFLLAAELDRHVMRRIYRMSWQRLTPVPWIPLLGAHTGVSQPTDALLAHPAAGLHVLGDQLAVLRADQLLDQLLDANAARAPMGVPQELTPALRTLADEGVEAFATRLATPPLSDEERAGLEAEEAELAGTGDAWSRSTLI